MVYPEETNQCFGRNGWLLFAGLVQIIGYMHAEHAFKYWSLPCKLSSDALMNSGFYIN
jgi:hypothetical protein